MKISLQVDESIALQVVQRNLERVNQANKKVIEAWGKNDYKAVLAALDELQSMVEEAEENVTTYAEAVGIIKPSGGTPRVDPFIVSGMRSPG